METFPIHLFHLTFPESRPAHVDGLLNRAVRYRLRPKGRRTFYSFGVLIWPKWNMETFEIRLLTFIRPMVTRYILKADYFSYLKSHWQLISIFVHNNYALVSGINCSHVRIKHSDLTFSLHTCCSRLTIPNNSKIILFLDFHVLLTGQDSDFSRLVGFSLARFKTLFTLIFKLLSWKKLILNSLTS